VLHRGSTIFPADAEVSGDWLAPGACETATATLWHLERFRAAGHFKPVLARSTTIYTAGPTTSARSVKVMEVHRALADLAAEPPMPPRIPDSVAQRVEAL
jgi:hypothetical protein